MSEFKKYQRKGLSEMRPYVSGEDLTDIGVGVGLVPISDMGMIARDPLKPADQWYVSRKQFEMYYELAEGKV